MKNTIFHSIFAVLLTAVLLFVLNVSLKGAAGRNAEKVLLHTLRTLVPGSGSFEEESYTGEDASVRNVWKSEAGFVVETANNGYADEITVMVGVSREGTVTGVVVKRMHETWGLGMHALTDRQYLAQYLRTTGDAEIGVNVDALTGATVTSKAITRCVNSAVAVFTGADTQSGATSWGG